MSDDPLHPQNAEAEIEYVSKSEVKREMKALQDLGAALLELTDKQLGKIPVPEVLLEQLAVAKKITSNSAKKRQLQYIGKVMRGIDPQPIRDALEELNNGLRKQARAHQQLEQLRDKLVAEGDPVINEIVDECPSAERQTLRQLTRQAQKEMRENKPPAASRKIFRYLKQLADQH